MSYSINYDGDDTDALEAYVRAIAQRSAKSEEPWVVAVTDFQGVMREGAVLNAGASGFEFDECDLAGGRMGNVVRFAYGDVATFYVY